MRYESARLRQEEFERRKKEEAMEPVWHEPPPREVKPRRSKDQQKEKHWLEIGHNVFYKTMIGQSCEIVFIVRNVIKLYFQHFKQLENF